MEEVIDLRSDTVTRPSPGMREAIAAAEVGDDQYGEDPSVNKLQEQVAALLGKESALWLATGTMANQVALRALTSPGDDVIVNGEAHIGWHETGGAAANAGVQLTSLGPTGIFALEDFIDAVKPRGHMVYPPTTLVYIENTHNRAGGVIFPPDEAERICEAAASRGVSTYLNGTRLWNAAAALERPVAELCDPFDLVSVGLAKGLGAPAGALLAGSSDLISRCRRYRRMFGGAMMQVGFLAAAGVYALEHNLGRIAVDNSNARLIAERLAGSDRVNIDLDHAKTNILMFGLSDDAPDATTLAAQAQERGVLLLPITNRLLRLVTHLDVTREQCERSAKTLLEIIDADTSRE